MQHFVVTVAPRSVDDVPRLNEALFHVRGLGAQQVARKFGSRWSRLSHGTLPTAVPVSARPAGRSVF